MTAKKTAPKKIAAKMIRQASTARGLTDDVPTTAAVFPYTNKPQSLRKFLQEVPKKPKPLKVDGALMKSWGFKDTNDMSIIRVLKRVGLLTGNNEPTDLYASFMPVKGGAAVLAKPVREVYAPLFNAAHKPYAEPLEVLQNLFNIHSGGSKLF